MTSLLPSAELQFSDADGKPYAGGSVGFYVPGTLTAKSTWQDSGASVLNTNPVVLDSAGRCIVWGSGAYRMILKDSAGNLIWDQTTAGSLSDTAVSAVMLPVVGATSLQSARDLMGVTSAIASAVSAVELMPGSVGPTGPTGAGGPTGPLGPQGVQGPPGSAASLGSGSLSTTGYMAFSNGLVMQWGQVTSATVYSGAGSIYAGFPIPFPNACFSLTGNAPQFSYYETVGDQQNLVTVTATVWLKDRTSYYFTPEAAGNNQATGTMGALCWMALGY